MMVEDRTRRLANGNEAVALAAIYSGVEFFSHYPGSPVNVVEPSLRRFSEEFNDNDNDNDNVNVNVDITINDSLNEHVAALSAAGASFCGARSMVVMKHVGLNIAADPFNYVGYTGVEGGMVVIVGTDPGATCSTGEEDVHWYAPQFNFPLLEPTSVQGIFDDVCDAFEISERYKLPALVFIPTRLCYNSWTLTVGDLPERRQRSHNFVKDRDRYINVGSNAVRRHRVLLEKIEHVASTEDRTSTFFNSNAEIGVITRGVTFGHVYESIRRLDLSENVELLNANLVYPLHRESLSLFFKGKREVIVIEDQDGFLEHMIKVAFFNEIDCVVSGKDHFPRYGETRLSDVIEFFSSKFNRPVSSTQHLLSDDFEVPERIGTFCEGCPHRSSYYAINKAIHDTDGVIGGDIGCSSLPPFLADWLMCMNAGIGVSQGMQQALGSQIVISTGGDGSFFHAGLLSLQSAVHNDLNLIHVVFDNQTVAMTGHQKSPSASARVDHRALLRSIGVDRCYDVSAHRPRRFAKLLKKEIGRTGVRVFWVKSVCQLTALPSNSFSDFRKRSFVVTLDSSRCGDCTDCYHVLACPAIVLQVKDDSRLEIDSARCARCGACADICERKAIKLSLQCSFTELLQNTFRLITSSLTPPSEGR